MAVDRRKDIEGLASSIGSLTANKNEAYGDSFFSTAAFLCLLYPTGIRPEQYSDALCVVRMFDKLSRIATRKGAFGESPYLDIAGYALLGALKDKD